MPKTLNQPKIQIAFSIFTTPNTTDSTHLYNTVEVLMMGIMVPETCWASSKFYTKNHLLNQVGIYISTYYKLSFSTKIGHLYNVKLWESEIPVLQRYMLLSTGLLLVLKMEAACSFNIFVSNNTNIRCHNTRHCQCAMLKPSFLYTQQFKTLHQ